MAPGRNGFLPIDPKVALTISILAILIEALADDVLDPMRRFVFSPMSLAATTAFREDPVCIIQPIARFN